jgi:hypothetical protein
MVEGESRRFASLRLTDWVSREELESEFGFGLGLLRDLDDEHGGCPRNWLYRK